MICPMCLGKGYATDEDIKEYPHRCPNCNGKGFYYIDWQKFRCKVCNGSGTKPMTNEEWLRSATTEQLAEFLADKCNEVVETVLSDASCDIGDIDNDDYWYRQADFVEWLKQPHNGSDTE